MSKASILYEENDRLIAKYHHPKSDDFLVYRYTIKIVDSGKNPIEIKMTFDGMPPAYAPMPPKEHTLKATNLIELHVKLVKWFRKYGYILLGTIEE
jgi:hypothetical protein